MKQKPLIVMYMHKIPYPKENGTNQRIYAMVHFLKIAYRVGLIIPYNSSGIEELYEVFDKIWYQKGYTNTLERLNNYKNRQKNKLFFYFLFTKHMIKFAGNPLGRFSIPAATTLYKVCKSDPPALIICQKIFNTVLSTAIARKFNIPVILDTHDLYKLQLNNESEKININLTYFSQITSQHEKDLLQLYDGLIAIQHHEATILKHFFPDKKIITALHPVAKIHFEEDTTHIYTTKPILLFVGSASNHNIDAITHFINNDFDYILNYHPDILLNICGDVCNYLNIHHKNIKLLGRVNCIETYYLAATLVINPVRYGSGLKIKIIDALSYSKCVVTTPNGTEGLLNIENVMVCVDDNNFGYTIIELLKNRESIRSFELAAYNYVKTYLSPEQCFSNLKNSIDEYINS